MKDFKLDHIPKINSGFKIPEGYFDDFDKKIMSALPQKEVKIFSIFRKSALWIVAAASLVIGFSVVYHFNDNDQISISNDEYLTLDENLHTEDFAAYLSEKDLSALEHSLTDYDPELKKLTDENF